jgi:hypothetical protein
MTDQPERSPMNRTQWNACLLAAAQKIWVYGSRRANHEPADSLDVAHAILDPLEATEIALTEATRLLAHGDETAIATMGRLCAELADAKRERAAARAAVEVIDGNLQEARADIERLRGALIRVLDAPPGQDEHDAMAAARTLLDETRRDCARHPVIAGTGSAATPNYCARCRRWWGELEVASTAPVAPDTCPRCSAPYSAHLGDCDEAMRHRSGTASAAIPPVEHVIGDLTALLPPRRPTIALPAVLTWTCIVCGADHPIDHVGLYLGSFMACMGCEIEVRRRWLSADARQAPVANTVTIPLALAAELDLFSALVQRGYVADGTAATTRQLAASRTGDGSIIVEDLTAAHAPLPPPVPIDIARDRDEKVSVPRALIRRLIGDSSFLTSFVETLVQHNPQLEGTTIDARRSIADRHIEHLADLACVDLDDEDLDD